MMKMNRGIYNYFEYLIIRLAMKIAFRKKEFDAEDRIRLNMAFKFGYDMEKGEYYGRKI